MYHLPEIGQGHIGHFAEGYEGILEAAASGSPNVTRDSDGLQYFALEAYAYDIIAPGVGCPGPLAHRAVLLLLLQQQHRQLLLRPPQSLPRPLPRPMARPLPVHLLLPPLPIPVYQT